ncbi:hypothetical protein JCM10908_001861 [Rhodotorula pacifica]|uniref:uncharacterized protein n=1 Tax=Rhodotorula pacifica TaxID=1495444 RepID=UPI0031706C38
MPPDRSSRGTSAVQDRPLSTSCTACRNRKVRCDSAKPACDGCVKQGTPEDCVYLPRQKPGLKSGFNTTLLERVGALEEDLTSVKAELAELRAQSGSQHATLSPASGSIPRPPTFDYQPLAGLPDPAHPPMNGMPPSSATIHSATPQSVVQESDLPPPELLNLLHVLAYDLYFQHVLPFAPMFQRSALDTIYNPDGSVEYGILTYGVVAASLRFALGPMWENVPKQAYRERARNRVIIHSTLNTTLASLQALTLVAIDDVVANEVPQAWGALALLTRTASHVQLHQEEPNSHVPTARVVPLRLLGLASSFAEEESRRRLFWCIFMLDRWSATATGWDFAFPSLQISRRLPGNDFIWCSDNPTTTPFFGLSHDNHDVSALSTHPDDVDMGFSALIEITDLLGGVHQLHRLTLDRNNLQHFLEQSRALASRIKAWNKSLPDAYTTLPDEDTKRVLVQLLYNAAQIKLHSLLAYPLYPSLTPNSTAAAVAHECARTIAQLSKIAPIRSPYSSWSCWTAGRILAIRAYKRREPLDPAIFDIVQSLASSGPFCALARRYAVMINRLIRAVQRVDGTLGGAAALVDLHHTAFSAELAVLPSGAVTPSPAVRATQQIDLGHTDYSNLLTESAVNAMAGPSSSSSTANGTASRQSFQAAGPSVAAADADIDMEGGAFWDETSNLLDPNLSIWLDLPGLLGQGDIGAA